MSLSARTIKIKYEADGAVTTFALPDVPIVDDSAEVVVYTRDPTASPATVTLQSEGALNDYTLTGAPDNDSFHTNVEFNTAPADDLQVIIILQLPLTQVLDYNGNNSAGVRPTQVEESLDRVVGMVQQLDEILSRSPRMNITEQVSVDALNIPDPDSDGTVGTIGLWVWGTDGTLTTMTVGELELAISGTPYLDDMLDVTITSVADEDVLQYDSGSGQWVNAQLATSAAYAVESIGASADITSVTNRIVQTRPVVGDGGAQAASTTPFGTTGGWDNGTQILLRGTSDTNTVTIAHNDAAKGAILNGDAVLANNNMLGLTYDSNDDRWIEMWRNF